MQPKTVKAPHDNHFTCTLDPNMFDTDAQNQGPQLTNTVLGQFKLDLWLAGRNVGPQRVGRTAAGGDGGWAMRPWG
jgi:hypothetical protein